MTAPDTNVDRQARRHRPALLAIAAVLVMAFVVLVVVVGIFLDEDDTGAAAPDVNPVAADTAAGAAGGG